MWIVVAIAILGVVAFAAARLVPYLIREYADHRRLMNGLQSSDWGLTPESFDRWPLGRERFTQTGRLPMSRIAFGDAFRWQDPKYFWSGEEFWRTFEDRPKKWEASQRYAGANLNCGHYFAVTPQGATAEATYYGMDLSKLQLLVVNGRSDCVLDLTHEDNLLEVSRLSIENPEALDDETYLIEILSLLTDESKGGGNALTDYIGYWAHNQGYDGIMFFGARALKSRPGLREQIRHGRGDRGLFSGQTYHHFEEMRRSYDLINVVYFSGAKLATGVQRYAFPADGKVVTNDLYGKSPGDIDSRLTYRQDFQESMTGRFTARKIKLEH